MDHEAVESGVGASKLSNFKSVVKTVFFAFFGVRKRADHEEETVKLSPVQIIVAGLVATCVFVVSLVMLAKYIVRTAMIE